MEATVPKLQNSGYDYVTHQNKLFPKVFTSESGNSLSKVMQAVGNNIKACRNELGDDKILQLLDKARYSMGMVHSTRQVDQDKGVINGVNNVIIQQQKTFVRNHAPLPLTKILSCNQLTRLYFSRQFRPRP